MSVVGTRIVLVMEVCRREAIHCQREHSTCRCCFFLLNLGLRARELRYVLKWCLSLIMQADGSFVEDNEADE